MTDQNRQQVSLSQFSGKVVAMTFVYVSCPLPNFCFRLSNNFGLLQKRFVNRMGQDLILLTITLDPDHDQPEALAKYGAIWKANGASWHFLTGSVPAVRKVTSMFGVVFNPDMGVVTHSLHTVIINRRGELVANVEGNEFTAKQLGDLVEVELNRTPGASPSELMPQFTRPHPKLPRFENSTGSGTSRLKFEDASQRIFNVNEVARRKLTQPPMQALFGDRSNLVYDGDDRLPRAVHGYQQRRRSLGSG